MQLIQSLVAVSVISLCACADGTGDTSSTAAPSAVSAAVPTESIAAVSTTSTLAGFQFSTVSPADRVNASCSGINNNTAVIGKVQLAQTHLLEPSHPFFQLSAYRSTLLRLGLSGTGLSPQVLVQASAAGQVLGSFCLSGPAHLSATPDDANPDMTTSFTGHIPSAWLVPNLQINIQAGATSRVLSSADLKIGPAPTLSLVTADWLLFGDTEPTPVPVGMRQELAAKLPLSSIRYANFPLALDTPKLPIPSRSDGLSPTGAVGPRPAMLVTSLSSCTAADKSAGTCLPWSNFAILDGIRSLTMELQMANGMERISHWYGIPGKNRSLGGGLGDASTASGGNYGLIFNHELGHTFDMPHWGDSLYSRVGATATQAHPYTSTRTNVVGAALGGGYGDSWAYDPIDNALVNPICAETGSERVDPMQRTGNGCLRAGQNLDFFGDYSALFIHRYFNGASTPTSGTVSSPRDFYGNTSPRYALPTKPGRPNLQTNPLTGSPTLVQWSATSNSYTERTPATVSSDSRVYGEYYPSQWNTPVITLWGAFSTATPSVTTIFTPLAYNGNLKRSWNPSNTADFAAIKAFNTVDGFWWGADLVVKAEFSNGSTKQMLVKRYVRGTDPLSYWSFGYWSVNIPAIAGARLTKVSLYHRPMESRLSDGGSRSSPYYVTTNINSTLNKALTASKYMATAKLVASRSF